MKTIPNFGEQIRLAAKACAASRDAAKDVSYLARKLATNPTPARLYNLREASYWARQARQAADKALTLISLRVDREEKIRRELQRAVSAASTVRWCRRWSRRKTE